MEQAQACLLECFLTVLLISWPRRATWADVSGAKQSMLNSNTLQYIPSVHILDQYDLSKRSDRQKREVVMLWLVAQGHTLRIEIQRFAAEYFHTNHRSGALMAVIPALIKKGLLYCESLPIPGVRSYGMFHLDAVCLTDAGRKLASGLSWSVKETELERMKRLHEKNKTENEHTAAALAFTYHARLRGWKAGVMPKVRTGNYRYAPDAVVAKGGREYHVEVELSWKVADPKWRNMARSRGIVALCARHENHQRALVGDVESVIGANTAIMATNLRTLFKDVQEEPLGKLWLERW